MLAVIRQLMYHEQRAYKGEVLSNFHIADFGMSEDNIEIVKEFVLRYSGKPATIIPIPDDGKQKGPAWLKKPTALLNCTSDRVLWVDNDVEVRANMRASVQRYTDNLEKYHIGHCIAVTNDWYTGGINSGVIVKYGRPIVLAEWEAAPRHHPKQRGDQEYLDCLMRGNEKYLKGIQFLDYSWNYQRLMIVAGYEYDEPKILHWTGPAGKRHIKRRIFPVLEQSWPLKDSVPF